jgi:uncharacterized protein YneF (UPF0154 family)
MIKRFLSMIVIAIVCLALGVGGGVFFRRKFLGNRNL